VFSLILNPSFSVVIDLCKDGSGFSLPPIESFFTLNDCYEFYFSSIGIKEEETALL
jgi:hypothetical protein